MSVVEVLVASVILLVALTAMLGLLMTSTGLSARARAESLAVKTASTFLEQVRAVKYAELTTSKLNGLASAASGRTVGGMTVSVEASMTPYWMPSQVSSDPPAYQQIKVLVRVTGPGFKSFDFATGTYVREWQWSERSNGIPTVQFDSLTPPAGATAEPVWGSIHVGATADSNVTDVMLTQIYVKIGTTRLTSATPNAMHGECGTTWDTTTWPDGEYTLIADAWDALNSHSPKFRTFAIDNVAPSAPTTVTFTSTTGDTAATLTWAQVLDGISLVPGYEASLEQQGSSGSWSTVSPAQRVARPAGDESLASVVYTTAPFGAFRASVSAIGPREWSNLTTPWRSAPTVGTLITRPSFTGMTVSVRQANGNGKPFYFTAANLTLSPPTFQGSAASYLWEYKVGTGAWTAFTGPSNPSSSNSVVFAEVAAGSERGPALSFRCKVTRDGTLYASPIMTRTSTAGGSTYTLANFTADWTAW
jgi:type II secretory pathway pseudopilin PulG